MKVLFLKAAVWVVVGPLIAGCGNDAPMPTGTTTVQLAVVAGGDHGGRPFSTPMTTEITSQPEYSGDPDGIGQARITINPGQRTVCWDLSASKIVLPATAAHIHRAPVGVRGGIVVLLSAPNASGRAEGCVKDQDRDVLRQILMDPEFFYVNVHTSDYPAGAVRGQLGK